MLLQVFSDDEHTAGWPYPRLLKSRKWLLLAASLAIAWAHFRLHPKAIEGLLGDTVSIERTVLAGVILFPLAILTAQFAVLLSQHLTSVDVVLSDRISALRSERAVTLSTRLDEARKAFSNANTEHDQANEKAEQLDEVIRHGLKDNSNARGLSGPELYGLARDLVNNGDFPRYDSPEWRTALSDRINLQRRIKDVADTAARRGTHLVDLEDEYETAAAKDPAGRQQFLRMEIVMDWLRIAPPVAVAAYAWVEVLRVLLPF